MHTHTGTLYVPAGGMIDACKYCGDSVSVDLLLDAIWLTVSCGHASRTVFRDDWGRPFHVACEEDNKRRFPINGK